MSKEMLGDVWKLETPDEDMASDDLNSYVQRALGNGEYAARARNYLKWVGMSR